MSREKQYFAAYWIDAGDCFSLNLKRFWSERARQAFCNGGKAKPVSARMRVGSRLSNRRLRDAIVEMKQDVNGPDYRGKVHTTFKQPGWTARSLTEAM